MAIYGCRGACIAPFDGADPTDGATAPSYGTVYTLSKVNQVADSATDASGTWYGDDSEAIKITEFVGGTIDNNFVDVEDSTLAVVLGVSSDSDARPGMAYGVDDVTPYCGYGFYTKRLDNSGEVYWETVFYPKVKAKRGDQTYKTKENNINVTYVNLPMDWMAPNCGKYKITKSFDTEALAKAYLAGLFAGTSTFPGLSAT